MNSEDAIFIDASGDYARLYGNDTTIDLNSLDIMKSNLTTNEKLNILPSWTVNEDSFNFAISPYPEKKDESLNSNLQWQDPIDVHLIESILKENLADDNKRYDARSLLGLDEDASPLLGSADGVERYDASNLLDLDEDSPSLLETSAPLTTNRNDVVSNLGTTFDTQTQLNSVPEQPILDGVNYQVQFDDQFFNSNSENLPVTVTNLSQNILEQNDLPNVLPGSNENDEVQDDSKKTRKRSRSSRRNPVKKLKMWQLEPSEHPESEQRIKDAIKAKGQRVKKAQIIEELTEEITTLKKYLEDKDKLMSQKDAIILQKQNLISDQKKMISELAEMIKRKFGPESFDDYSMTSMDFFNSQ